MEKNQGALALPPLLISFLMLLRGTGSQSLFLMPCEGLHNHVKDATTSG